VESARLIVTPTSIGIIKIIVKTVLLIVSLVPACHRAKPVQPEKEFSMDSVLLALRQELLWTMVFANPFVLPFNISIIKEIVTIVLLIVQHVPAHHHAKHARLEKEFTMVSVRLVLQELF